MNQRKMDMRKISKNIWKESESKIKMSTENETISARSYFYSIYTKMTLPIKRSERKTSKTVTSRITGFRSLQNR